MAQLAALEELNVPASRRDNGAGPTLAVDFARGTLVSANSDDLQTCLDKLVAGNTDPVPMTIRYNDTSIYAALLATRALMAVHRRELFPALVCQLIDVGSSPCFLHGYEMYGSCTLIVLVPNHPREPRRDCYLLAGA